MNMTAPILFELATIGFSTVSFVYSVDGFLKILATNSSASILLVNDLHKYNSRYSTYCSNDIRKILFLSCWHEGN